MKWSFERIFERSICHDPISAGIIGGATLLGAGLSYAGTTKASNTAAGAQREATAANIAEQQAAREQQQKNLDITREQFAPYRAVGEKAIDPFNQMLYGKYDMAQSPSAVYALQQGSKQVNSALQSRGLEGNAVTQLGQLGSSVAAQDYQQRFNNLLNAMNVGTSATAGTASATNAANANIQSGANVMTGANTSAAQNLGNIAQTQGANQSNIIGSAAGNLAGMATNMMGYKTPQVGQFNQSWGANSGLSQAELNAGGFTTSSGAWVPTSL